LYFCPIFLNLFIVYCVEVVGKKQKQKQEVIGITQRMVWGLQNWIYPIWSRQQYLIGNSEIQPLENASINETTNRIQILTRQFASHDSETEPLFCITNLSFSAPKSHQRTIRSGSQPLPAPTRSGRNSP